MQILYVILSAAISSIIAIFTISNFSEEKVDAKTIIKFLTIMLTLGVVVCIFFESIYRLILTIVVTKRREIK